LAHEVGGKTFLRFDDTNPEGESEEYAESIKRDLTWLGLEWEELHYASDYFEIMYNLAEGLIQKGLAYVDDSSEDEIRECRGNLTTPGKPTKYRDRSMEENLDFFRRMRACEFEEGTRVLRAKIDLASPNMNLRDPIIYRIMFKDHYRTKNNWCIYPMYDYAHGQSDSIEEITHSLCSLEFEVHRPLYNWFIEQLEIFPSRQIEFARLNLNYTVMSKRKLLRLVEEGVVDGWDDPRRPTISGLRRRGYTPESIRDFAERVGLAKRNNVIDIALLEFSIREHLNKIARRVMGVLRPLKVVVLNYPENHTEWLPTENNPEDAEAGTRDIPFGRELFIEHDDFMVDPPKKYFRLAPGGTVRLKSAYIIEYVGHETVADGEVTEVHVNYHANSKSGSDTSGIKTKGTLHWVSAEHAQRAEVRLYDRLFHEASPDAKDRDFMEFIHPDSLEVITDALVEPVLLDAQVGDYFQFQRIGYFAVDSKYSSEGRPVFNRTVTLKDGWKPES
jgi:glutaminyl-tRNA synthetase